VIATGFQRDNLPQIERKPTTEFISHTDQEQAPAAAVAEEPVIRPQESEPAFEFASDISAAQESHFEYTTDEGVATEEKVYEESADSDEATDLDMDDIEIPAIVRRERGVFSFSRRSDND